MSFIPRKNIAVLTLAYKQFRFLPGMYHDFIFNAVDGQNEWEHKQPSNVFCKKIFNLQNEGFAPNWNKAIEQLKREYPQYTHFVLQNPDLKYRIADYEEALKEIPTETHLATFKFNSVNPWIARPAPNKEIPYVEFTSPIVSLELWDKIGGLDAEAPHWGNDIVFGYQAWELGYTPKVMESPFSFYHDDKHSSTPNFNQKLFSQTMVAYLEKRLGADWQQKVLSHTPHIKRIW